MEPKEKWVFSALGHIRGQVLATPTHVKVLPALEDDEFLSLTSLAQGRKGRQQVRMINMAQTQSF